MISAIIIILFVVGLLTAVMTVIPSSDENHYDRLSKKYRADWDEWEELQDMDDLRWKKTGGSR